MKTEGILIALLLLIALPLRGQDSYPTGEVFGGYSFSHGSADSVGHNLNGWGASFSGAGTRYFGMTADFSGTYGSGTYIPFCFAPAIVVPVPPGCPTETQNLSAYHFLFGPRFTLRTQRATPFAEALFGVSSLRQEKAGTRTGFAMGFGGGVDVPLTEHFAYRVFQVDYIPARKPNGLGGWDYEFRVQTGIVFTFGRK